MDVTRQINAYCERTGPEYWAEPVNALTNLAFLVVAAVMWRRGAGDTLARTLSGILFAIGVTSWLWHTHAQIWAAMADSLAILCYILVYIYAINRFAWGLSRWSALALTGVFLPYSALLVPVFQALPFLDVSAVYWPVPLLIALYALALWRRDRALAFGLLAGAGVLVASLVFRSLDEIVCAAAPLGTHFMWHILNAIMLGWMIEVYLRLRARQSPA